MGCSVQAAEINHRRDEYRKFYDAVIANDDAAWHDALPVVLLVVTVTNQIPASTLEQLKYVTVSTTTVPMVLMTVLHSVTSSLMVIQMGSETMLLWSMPVPTLVAW